MQHKTLASSRFSPSKSPRKVQYLSRFLLSLDEDFNSVDGSIPNNALHLVILKLH